MLVGDGEQENDDTNSDTEEPRDPGNKDRARPKGVSRNKAGGSTANRNDTVGTEHAGARSDFWS